MKKPDAIVMQRLKCRL